MIASSLARRASSSGSTSDSAGTVAFAGAGGADRVGTAPVARGGAGALRGGGGAGGRFVGAGGAISGAGGAFRAAGDKVPSLVAFSLSNRSRRRRSLSSACFSAALAFSSASFFSCCKRSSTPESNVGEADDVTPRAAIRAWIRR